MPQNSAMSTGPLFSIGVTTYNRNELLKECLNSILQQEFSDYEIIVGNDYTQQLLSAAMLDISDPRIRIVNNPVNLGPVGNANSMIGMSRGRYFTLLADDDLHSSCFLQAMSEMLLRHENIPCIFSSFSSDIDVINNLSIRPGEAHTGLRTYSGRQFLNSYLARAVSTIGCYGIFDLEYLRKLGGLAQLGRGRSMYAEMPLVLSSGLLETVLYLDYPLVFFRAHAESLSYSFSDVEGCLTSQQDLLKRCNVLFREGEVREDFHMNTFLLLKWCVQDFATVMHRSGSIDMRISLRYMRLMGAQLMNLKGTPYLFKSIAMILHTFAMEMLLALRGVLKRYRDSLRAGRN